MLPRGSECPGESIEMVSFAMDPQWCGHLFSVYYRHEKVIASALGADAFAISSFSGPDVGWIAVAGTFGLEVSSAWAVALESVKATGVIFLLGVGSLMFYKLYHFCCTRRPRPPEHSPSDSMFHRPRNLHFSFSLADASEGEDAETLKSHGVLSGSPPELVNHLVLENNGRVSHLFAYNNSPVLVENLRRLHLQHYNGLYFGPRSPACDDDDSIRMMNDNSAEDESVSPSSSSYGGTSGDEDADISEGSNIGAVGYGNHQRSRDSWSPPVRQRSQTLHKAHCRPLGHPLNPCCPRGWKRPRHFSTPVSVLSNQPGKESWLMGRLRNIVMPSFNTKETKRDTISLPATPGREKLRYENGSMVEADWIESWRLMGRQAPDGAETNKSNQIPCTLPVKKFTIAEEPTKSLNDSKILSDESHECSGFSDNGNGESGQNILREGSFDSTCSDLSLDFSLRESVDTSTMACMEKLQKEIDQLKTNCLIMDEEFETIKCNRNLPGMSSLMKSNIGVNDSHLAALESNPSEEMESVKKEKARACFAGLYSLTTIKNSTSSELSDSFPPPCGRVSVGSAESLEWDSPKVTSPLRDVSSIREENSPIKVVDCVPDVHGEEKSSANVLEAFHSPLAPSEDEAMVSLEWDNDDLVEYPEEDIDCFISSEGLQAVISSDIELSYVKELGLPIHSDQLPFSSEAEGSSDTINYATSGTDTERFFGAGNHQVDSQMADSMMSASMMSSLVSSDYKTSNLEALPLGHWSSEESGYMDWDGRCDGNRSSQWSSPIEQAKRLWGENSYAAESSCDTSELSTPAIKPSFSWDAVEPKMKNIGDRIELREYAKREWLYSSRQHEILIEAYHEIPSTLGLDYVRQIREDNSALRATIFQTLTQNIAVPSGSETYQKLVKAHGEGCHWLQDWRFPNNLPYCKDNVLQGMKLCLEKLDSLAAMVAISNDKETTLAGLLNADSSLDLHVVEAVKLHMLLCAMELHAQNTSGAEVPLFAILLFARDTSETPKDFMNNHLRQVENFGGMEQVEMFLLGYTLGVTLQVVRPFYYGTKEYICRYPDWNVGTWPQVTLIAENDHYYNVLLK